MPEFSRYSAHHSTVALGFGRHDEAVLVTVSGHVDLNTAAHVRERVLEQVGPDAGRLVLDLGDVGLLDSAGIGALALVNRALQQRHVPVAVVTSSRHLRKLFRIAALDQVLALHDTLDEALGGPGDEPVSAG